MLPFRFGQQEKGTHFSLKGHHICSDGRLLIRAFSFVGEEGSFKTVCWTPLLVFWEKGDLKQKWSGFLGFLPAPSSLGKSQRGFKKDVIGKSGCVWEPSTVLLTYNLCVEYEGQEQRRRVGAWTRRCRRFEPGEAKSKRMKHLVLPLGALEAGAGQQVVSVSRGDAK